MEHFPFEQIVGLIVFVIIALAQFWTKLRTGKPMPHAEEDQEPQFPEFRPERQTPKTAPPPIAPSRVPDQGPRIDDLLREALGLPHEGKAPPAPAPKPVARPHVPPPIVQQPQMPRPRRLVEPMPAPPPPAAQQTDVEEAQTGSVLASLERLEREAAQIRERVGRLGHLQVAAGAQAEARMRQRLAGLMKGIAEPPVGSRPGMSFVRRILSSPKTIRHAIVLNEVLGKPRGLDSRF